MFDRFAMPPMLVAIARDLDVPLSQAVAAAGAYFLAYGLMQPVWGVLSTRIGLATTMRWCILAGGLATLATAFAPGVLTLTIGRAVGGALFAAGFPAALIYVGTTAAPGQRQREVTRLMTGAALGTALATAIAGGLTYLVGWRSVLILSGILAIGVSMYLWKLVELTPMPWRAPLFAPLRRVLTRPAVLVLLVLAALDGAAILGALTFLPTAVESTGRNTATAAGITALYGVSVWMAAVLVGRLSNRISGSQFILAGAAAGAAGCGLLAISVDLAVAGAGCLLLGIAWASMHSSLQTWATEVMPPDRGLTVSFFAGSLFAGSALAAAIGGPFAEAQNFVAVFAAAAVVLVLVGASGYIARAHWERRQ